jgi:SAGA-associated factor 29
MVDGVNSSNESIQAIVTQDSYIAKNKDGIDLADAEQKLDSLLRSGVKGSDISKQQIDALIEHVTVLRALVKAREDSEAQTAGASGPPGRERPSGLLAASSRSASARGASARDKERDKDRDRDRDRDPGSVYEFDGSGDSPVPSPAGRKLGGSAGAGSDRSGNRDSVPPRGDHDTPGKADSVPPESGGSGATAAQRARVSFFKGQDVVFKPKAITTTDSTEWMLGKVQQVLGEGKSRRYKVQDADPDLPADQRVEYRTSASSMIPIPATGADLPPLDRGKTVLALYPDSTTFYKAEVMGGEAAVGKVSLRFEGEENNVTLQLVDRRFVVEYRN